MTTQTAVMQNQPSFPTRLLLLIAIAVVLAVGLVYGEHAVARHGADAVAVRKCIENGGTIETWSNPKTLRDADICKLDDGRFGVQIYRFGEEITSFAKEKLRRLDQVQRYLANRGYIPVE